MAGPSNEPGHQEAQDCYLGGSFADACRSWERVLARNPDDVHAREGIRLCKLLLGDEQMPAIETRLSTGKPVMADQNSTQGPDPLEDAGPGPLEKKLSLAKTMMMAGNTEESTRLLCEILEIEPGHAEAGRLIEESTASLVEDSDLDEGLSVLDLPSPPAMDPTSCATNPGIETLSDDPSLHPTLGSQAEPDRQGQGLDLGDIDQAESLSLGAEVPQDEPRRGIDGIAQMASAAEDPEEKFDLDFAVGDLDADGFVPTPPQVDPAVTAGEGELSIRIDELLSEARAAEADDALDDALARVERALILDPDSKAALGLRRELEKVQWSQAPEIVDRIDKARRFADEGQVEKAEKQYRMVLEKIPDHAQAKEGLAELLGSTTEQDDEAVDEELLSVEALAFPDGLAESPQPVSDTVDDSSGEVDAVALQSEAGESQTASPSLESFESPAMDHSSKKLSSMARLGELPKSAKIGVASIGTLLLVWGGLQWFGGGASGDVTSPPPVIESATSEPSVGTKTPAPDQPAPSIAAAPSSGVVMPPTLAETFDAAQLAEDNRDWERAIVLFNHALQLEPGNMTAVNGLAAAAVSYEDTRRLEGVWKQIEDFFESGGYKEALRMLYRMPPETDPERVARATAAGWHNLAVTALRAGDPQVAIEHLNEALAAQPNNAGLASMRDLAESFIGTEKTARYYRRVESLEHRDVDGVSAENASPR